MLSLGLSFKTDTKQLEMLYLWVVSVNQLEGIGETLEDASLFHDAQHLAS